MKRSKNSSGFTLIELLVSIVFVVVFVLVLISIFNVGGSLFINPTWRMERGEANASIWIEKQGITDVSGFGCSADNSDGDSYVSCTVTQRAQSAAGDVYREVIPIECSIGRFQQNTGSCRYAAPVIPTNNNYRRR